MSFFVLSFGIKGWGGLERRGIKKALNARYTTRNKHPHYVHVPPGKFGSKITRPHHLRKTKAHL
jgi:hypothetical protein